jgi:hypothetical protein
LSLFGGHLKNELNPKNEKPTGPKEKKLFRKNNNSTSKLADTDVLSHNLKTVKELKTSATKRKRELIKGGNELQIRTAILEQAAAMN